MLGAGDINVNRLYLSEGPETVYIDTCKMPPHHIDGIRFLFKQWKRKRLAVIINDAFSYGRNIQIILFLKAVLAFLDKPVLVLCREGTQDNWVDRFITWADLVEDVTIETRNPGVRNRIIVNPMVNLPLFCSREWSILIVDGDKEQNTGQILKLPFRADFKIWNTTTNLKEDLDTFAEIYKWLYPYEIFDKSYFIPDNESAVDVIEKSILLDSFMEDLVIRRDDLNSSFEKYQQDLGQSDLHTITEAAKSIQVPLGLQASLLNKNIDIPLIQATSLLNTNLNITVPQATTVSNTSTTMPPPQTSTTYVSKKNKDATGTKIKRSKKRIEQESTVQTPPTPAPAPPTGEPSTAHETDIEDFSIHNYERINRADDNSEQLQKKDESQSVEVINIDNTDDQSLQLYYESDTGDNLVEMDTLTFGSDLIVKRVKANRDKETPSDITEKTSEELAKVLIFKPSEQTTSIRKLTGAKCYSKNVSPRTYLEKTSTSISLGRKKDTADELNAEGSSSHFVKSKPVPTPKELKQKKQYTRIMYESDDSDDTDDELEINLNRNKHTTAYGTKKSNEVTKVQKKHSVNINDSRTVKVNCDLQVKTNEPTVTGTNTRITEQVEKSLKRNNIDENMKECEKNIRKKFKGSILDSLF